MEQGWQRPFCSAAVDIVFYVKDPMNENKPFEKNTNEQTEKSQSIFCAVNNIIKIALTCISVYFNLLLVLL